MTSDLLALIVLGVVLLATVGGVSFYIFFGRLIMRSRVVGAPVPLSYMLRLLMSGINANALVVAYLDAKRAGVPVTLEELEGVARGRGDPRAAVRQKMADRASSTS